MISVIIPTLNAAAHLARALAPLVMGVAQGLVKQAIIADGGSSDATLAIAEEAGCDIVRAAPSLAPRLNAGAASAKAPWLMFLAPDLLLEDAWLSETEQFLRASDGARAGLFRASPTQNASFVQRLRTALEPIRASEGLLISRASYAALGGFRDGPDTGADFARRLGPLTRLKAKAVRLA